jgi:hypothetical protein
MALYKTERGQGACTAPCTYDLDEDEEGRGGGEKRRKREKVLENNRM